MDYIFSKKALEEVDGKTVPLVVYYGEERRVIGEATLHTDDQGLFADFTVNDKLVDSYLKGDQG